MVSKIDLEKLVESENYNIFLKKLIQIAKKYKYKLSYASISRNAGFKSRSFPREVILGSKKLSIESMHKFAKGLDLSTELTQYFIHLVELSIPECRINTSEIAVIKNIDNLKNRILEKDKKIKSTFNDPYISYHIPYIYAALGSIKKGSTINEIARKTKLPVTTISDCLSNMISMNLITKNGVRFFYTLNHVSFQYLNQKSNFKSYFKHNLNLILTNFEDEMETKNKLYFASTFSVNSKKLPDLTKELRSILLKYIDQNEDENGDSIISLTCGLR